MRAILVPSILGEAILVPSPPSLGRPLVAFPSLLGKAPNGLPLLLGKAPDGLPLRQGYLFVLLCPLATTKIFAITTED